MQFTKAKMVRPWLTFLAAAGIVAFGCLFGDMVDEKDQGSLFSALGTISGVIFGVIGVWIAIVYPGALRKILDKSAKDENDHVSLVRRLLLPMILSTLVLALTLIGSPVAAVFVKSAYFKDAPGPWLKMSFTFLLLLTCVQFYALIYTLVPLGVADAVLSQAAEDKSIRKRVLGQTQVHESATAVTPPKEENPTDEE